MAEALIKFSQDTVGTGGNGIAFAGVLGELATIANSDNTGVASWEINLVYWDPSSTVWTGDPFAFSNNGNTPTATFTPDVSRSYRFMLKVWSVPNRPGAPDSVDIRVFTVKEANNLVIPPSQIWPRPLPPPTSGETGNKPNEMNFDGQPDGWAGTSAGDGLLNDTLTKVLFASPQVRYVEKDTLVPHDRQNGSKDLPYATLQRALDDASNGANGTSWTIYMAPGHYDTEVPVIPPQRRIAIIGADFGLVHINTSSTLPSVWNIRGTSYLSIKNIQWYTLSIISAEDSDPPDVGSLFVENSKFQSLDSSSVSCDIIAVGPNTQLVGVYGTGRVAVDGIDSMTYCSCANLAAYDTLITGGGTIEVSADAVVVDCQIDSGTEFDFSGYASTLYVDSLSKYWIDTNGIDVEGATTVLMAVAPLPVIKSKYVNADVEGTTYNVVPADAGMFIEISALSALVTVKLPSLTMPVGCVIYFMQAYTKQLLIQGNSGVTVYSAGSLTLNDWQPGLMTYSSGSVIQAYQVTLNQWVVSGDLLSNHVEIGSYYQSGSSFSLVYDMLSKQTLLDNATTITVTIPTNLNKLFPPGTKLDFMQYNTGQIVFSPAVNVTLVSPESFKSRKQYSQVTLTNIGVNSWALTGDLELA